MVKFYQKVLDPAQDVPSTALYGWGDDSSGQIGDNSIVNKSNAVMISNFLNANISSLIVGSSHAVALKTDGSLWTWGNNSSGQLGNGTTINQSSPIQIGSSSWSSISASNNTTYAITTDGLLYAWGENTSSQIGDNTAINKSSPVLINVYYLAATTATSTALSFSSITNSSRFGADQIAGVIGNNFYIGGDNSFGQLADGTTVNRSTPAAVTPFTGNFKSISLGPHSLLIANDSSLWAWGQNTVGQLGDGTTINKSLPVKIGNSSWSAVDVGASLSVAIDINGKLYTWGLNSVGQLGDGTTINKSSPALMAGSTSWSKISAGYVHVAAVSTTGALFVWGQNQFGTIGDGTTVNKSSPVQIGSKSWSVISAGTYYNLAIDTAGALFAWGYNGSNNFGTYLNNNRSSPVQVPTNVWTSFSFGAGHVLGLKGDGTLWAAGYNNKGQLGDGTTIDRSSFVQIGSGTTWNKISANSNKSGGGTTDGKFYLWGGNLQGGLGDGTTIDKSSPVLLAGSNSWQVISAGTTSFGITTGGALFSWGENGFGQLGSGTTVNRSSPLQVGTSTAWQKIWCSDSTTYAIFFNGLYTWGYGANGQLGDPSTTRSSPVRIGLSSWSQVVSGSNHALAIDINGKLWGWGLNQFGNLGDGTTVAKNSPIAIMSANTFDTVLGGRIAAGNMGQSLALDNSGVLWSWGYNQNGELGDGTQINKSSPVSLGTGYQSVYAGWFQSAATTPDSYIYYGWGSNVSPSPFGILGDGTTVSKSSPTLISSHFDSWTAISACKLGLQAQNTTHSLLIKNNGALYAVGMGTSGQIGDGSALTRSVLTQIGTSSWTFVNAGEANSIAIDINGRLFAWGLNQYGAIGDGTTVNKSSPVLLNSVAQYNSWSSNTSFTLVSTGFANFAFAKPAPNQSSKPWGRTKRKTAITYTTCASILDDGSLWVWGSNSAGQLGDGTTVSKSSPVQIGASSWTFVSSNANSNAGAIDINGRLFTWGNNANGQLGSGTTIDRSSPVQVGTSSWSFVHANVTTGAIDINGRLFVWGYNNQGQLGDGTTLGKSSPVQVSGSWTVVRTGSSVGTYAINTTGQLWAWGRNLNGYLGDGTTIDKSSPVLIDSGPWADIETQLSWVIGLKTNGSLWAWGANSVGQLGDGTTINKSSPVQIGTSSWSAIDRGGSAAIDINGRLFTWGFDNSAGTTVYRSSPVQIASDQSWVALVGQATNVGTQAAQGAINNKGGLFIWGYNLFGAVGDGTTIDRNSPVALAGRDKLIAWPASNPIGAANYPSYSGTYPTFSESSWRVLKAGAGNGISGGTLIGIKSNYTMWSWGQNNTGQLGDGTTTNKSSPIQIGISSWTTVSVGGSHAAGITTTGELYVWGGNAFGQLGDGTTINKSYPVKIGSSSWSIVECSQNYYTTAIASDRKLFTWGRNPFGNLGDGTTIDKSSPVQIGASSWTTVSAAAGMVAAIDINGKLFTWGDNGFGQIGDGTTINKSSPVLLAGTSSWSVVTAFDSAAAAITTTGALFTWGINTTGQLGSGTTTNRSSPVQVGTSSWTLVDGTAASGAMLAVDASGKLYAWGDNRSGSLGDGTTINKSSPVLISTSGGGLFNRITAISGQRSGFGAGQGASLAIDNLGKAFVWGNNFTGQMGDGTTVNKSSPTLLPSNTGPQTLTKIVETSGSAYGIDQAQNIWGIGLNSSGQLGDGTTVNKTTFTQNTFFNANVQNIAVGTSHVVVQTPTSI